MSIDRRGGVMHEHDYEYRIVRGESVDGSGPWWSVVQYIDGVCKGGDHHWLRLSTAHRARTAYLQGMEFPLPAGGMTFEEWSRRVFGD
jgi:hypothetical protein